jgi:hypothetical protein
MTHEEWLSLQGSSGWRSFRTYCVDYRDRIMEKWANGELKNPDEGMYKCQILGDIADLDWDSISSFYGLEQEQDNDPSSN